MRTGAEGASAAAGRRMLRRLAAVGRRPVGLIGLAIALGAAAAPVVTAIAMAPTPAPAGAALASSAPTSLQLARATLITRSDLPAGWVAVRTSGPTHTAPLSAALADCIGLDSSVATVKPLKVHSPDFVGPGHSATVEDSNSVYATAAQAAAAYKALANPRTAGCVGRLNAAALGAHLAAEVGRGAIVDSISIGPLPPGAAEPGQTGMEVTVPLTQRGKNLTVTSLQIDSLKGRVLQQLTFDGNGAPFTPLLQVHLLQIATGRA